MVTIRSHHRLSTYRICPSRNMWNSKSSASRDRSGASFIKTAIHAATGASFAISSPRHAVALASPTSWNSASTDNRGRTISTLSNAIDLLATSKELVPIDAVKGVFSVLGGVLILVRVSLCFNRETVKNSECC